jgi:hypothetical protein
MVKAFSIDAAAEASDRPDRNGEAMPMAPLNRSTGINGLDFVQDFGRQRFQNARCAPLLAVLLMLFTTLSLRG